MDGSGNDNRIVDGRVGGGPLNVGVKLDFEGILIRVLEEEFEEDDRVLNFSTGQPVRVKV